MVGCGGGIVHCRFRIWCVIVAVGWCLRGAVLIGGGWGRVVCLGGAGCCWWVIGWGGRVVRLAVRGRWRRWVC